MAVSADKLVQVLPRVITAGSSTLELNGLMISTNSFIPTAGILEFHSADSVASYFGESSTEYTLAVNYFLGFDNSTKKPTTLLFARDLSSALAGSLFGGKVLSTTTVIKAITDGAMDITIGTVDVSLTGLDFSSITSYSDAAVVIETALQAASVDPLVSGATVEYSSINKNFIITVGGTGETASISYATPEGAGTDLSSLLLLDATGAIFLSQGVDATPIATNMNRIKTTTLNWICFMTVTEATEDDKLAYATWTNGQNNGARFAFICQDSDVNAKVENNETNVGYLIDQLDLSGTSLQYNTANISAFVMGATASINYTVVNGRITYAFKQQSGLAYTVNTDEDADGLLSNGYNFYGNYATNNANYRLYQDSTVSGKYGHLDTLVNAVWLNDRLQTNWMDLLSSINSLPYNQPSYDKVKGATQDTIDLAVANGVITQGIVLNSSQKIQIESEAGLDISDILYTTGYYLQVLDPGATVRAERGSPVINFWYNDGGSIQRIVANSTVIL